MGGKPSSLTREVPLGSHGSPYLQLVNSDLPRALEFKGASELLLLDQYMQDISGVVLVHCEAGVVLHSHASSIMRFQLVVICMQRFPQYIWIYMLTHTHHVVHRSTGVRGVAETLFEGHLPPEGI